MKTRPEIESIRRDISSDPDVAYYVITAVQAVCDYALALEKECFLLQRIIDNPEARVNRA